MQQARRGAGAGIFEVILYIENSSWLFSTCAYSSHSKAALEFAEKEFSVHALHHRLDKLRARFACVMDQINSYYFAKRNGRWQIDSHRPGPKLSCNATRPIVTDRAAKRNRSPEYLSWNTNLPENRRR